MRPMINELNFKRNLRNFLKIFFFFKGIDINIYLPLLKCTIPVKPSFPLRDSS